MFSSVLLTLSLVGISAGLFYVFLIWNFDYWKKRGVKGPTPTPFYGNLPSMINQKRNVVYDLQDIYKQYREDVDFVGIFLIRTPHLMLLDTKLVQSVLIKDFKNFHDNEGANWFDEKSSRIMAENPFALRGDKWKERRQEISPGFTPSKIKASYPVTQEVCERFVKYIYENGIYTDSDGFDAKDLSLRFTSEVVSDCVLGIKAGSFSHKPTEILSMAEGLFQPYSFYNIYALIAEIWPKLLNFYKIPFFRREVEDFFFDLMNKAFDMRRKQSVDRVDFLNFILQLQEKKHLTNEQLASHSMTFLVDGFETTASVITHCLYQLAKYPEVQEKLHKELLDNENEKGQVDFDKLNDLTYLDQCVYESMRIIPPLPISSKVCTVRCELTNKNDETIKMHLNDIVLIPTFCFHHDERYFSNPNEFIPERFDPELGSVKKFRDMGVLLPFSDGPRICMGMRFALVQIKAGLVGIVKNFHIKLNPKTRRDNRMDPISVISSLEGGVWLDFEKRK